MHKYHGQKKEARVEKLLNYDVVLTTFATLTADFSKATSILKSLTSYRLVVDEGD